MLLLYYIVIFFNQFKFSFNVIIPIKVNNIFFFFKKI